MIFSPPPPAASVCGSRRPATAYLTRALAAVPELGALETTVEAIDPQTMVQLSDSPVVREVADDADARLRKALDGLSDAKDISS